MILAGLLLKLGGFGMVKFLLPQFSIGVLMQFRPLVLTLAMGSFVYGAVVAVRQLDLKKFVAFLSISHMGLATAGIFTQTYLGLRGGIYLMLNHGVTSAALFYLVGALSERFHSRSVLVYKNLYSRLPRFSVYFVTFLLISVGFPGSGSFLAEFLIVCALVKTN
jgi:NADH-quinone oxidoreductase subunit M